MAVALLRWLHISQPCCKTTEPTYYLVASSDMLLLQSVDLLSSKDFLKKKQNGIQTEPCRSLQVIIIEKEARMTWTCSPTAYIILSVK